MIFYDWIFSIMNISVAMAGIEIKFGQNRCVDCFTEAPPVHLLNNQFLCIVNTIPSEKKHNNKSLRGRIKNEILINIV